MPGASGSSRCSSGMISSRMKRRTWSRSTRSSSGSVNPGNIAMGRDDTIAAMADEILATVADGIATVTLNRPDQRNAMSDAIAGGCELALHCDLRVMAEHARIGMPLARIGMIVPFSLGQKLVEIMGPAHTRHLLFTGRPIDGRRAYEIGMVHQLAPAAEVEAAAITLAR